MNLFNTKEPRNFIKIGRQFFDADQIMHVYINPHYIDENNQEENVYVIRIMLDMSPQYPICKSIFISYKQLVELFYTYPLLTGKEECPGNLKKFILEEFSYDPSDDFEEAEREMRQQKNVGFSPDEDDEEEEIREVEKDL